MLVALAVLGGLVALVIGMILRQKKVQKKKKKKEAGSAEEETGALQFLGGTQLRPRKLRKPRAPRKPRKQRLLKRWATPMPMPDIPSGVPSGADDTPVVLEAPAQPLVPSPAPLVEQYAPF